MMNRRRASLFLVFLIIGITFGLGAQELSLEAMQALDEWRWGVVAYNDGLPGKSLLAMERAVSLNPTNPEIREWLGRAYWRSGMEDAALATWDELIQEGQASASLQGRIEQLRRRLTGEDEIPVDDEWIPLVAFHGVDGDTKYFERPSVARSLGDGSGSLLVSSYAGGELVQLDANGTLVERFEGGVEGFDRPFDILPTGDGRLLVSEFQSDRISVLSLDGYEKGYRIDRWGGTGRGSDELLGPQYMALSPDRSYVYVSDWGNRRISKWRLDGTHVLNFEAGGRFDGFGGPSGVACFDDRVYVADSLRARVDVFDPSGNYLGPLVESGLKEPEGLAIQGEKLLIADGANIHKVDLVSGEMTLEASLGGGTHRITTVFPDENGNLAVCDFDSDRIVLLTPLSTLYGGLNITLDRVRADAYPTLVVDLTVQDRAGNPISGLDSTNFRVFDGELPIGRPILDWRSSEDSSVSVVSVVDGSGGIPGIRTLFNGIDEIIGAFQQGDEFALVQATADPVIYDLQEGTGPEEFYRRIAESVPSTRIPWDESLRLAATRIAPERKRKAVVALVSTAPSATAFDTYGLVETARLMANNGIAFFPIYADENAVSRELDYIASETGGQSSLLFRPEGSGRIIDDLRRKSVGRYTVTWETPRPSGFGRDLLPVSVEVIYINKSGRDESGSFAPLQ